MAVKFPLEMKDGIMVRNISELKDNFDVEKVVGYFLDGRLKKWLDARWYEDESEAIGKLDMSDELLAYRLCKIFGVEYAVKEINTEVIAARNVRIAKLKQYTDDTEIIKNVDSIAFTQEELEDLYKQDLKKIYLCGDEFKISKSKKEVQYILIGEVAVEEIENRQQDFSSEDYERLKENILNQKLVRSSIPQELADTIGERKYAESLDYVAWKIRDGYDSDLRTHYYRLDKRYFNKALYDYEMNHIGIWDKQTEKTFLVRTRCDVQMIKFINRILLTIEGSNIGSDYYVRVYEFNDNTLECMWEKRLASVLNLSEYSKAEIDSAKYISSHKLEIILRGYNGSVGDYSEIKYKIIIDINTFQEKLEKVLLELNDQDSNNEVYINGLGRCSYNLDKKSEVKFLNKELNVSNVSTWYYHNELFIVFYKFNKTRLVSINSEKEVVEHINVQENWVPYIKIDINLGKFVVNSPYHIHVFDMCTKIMDSITMDEYCFAFLVGKYLYLRPINKRGDYPSYRIDLDNVSAGVIRIQYKYVY